MGKLSYAERVTRKVLKGMFQENTGAHFLDSGGAYGRNYDWNAKRTDWIPSNDRVSIAPDGDNLILSIDAFSFLCSCLTYDGRMQRKFDRFVRASEDTGENKSWLELMAEWTDSLEDVAGLYGEGTAFTVNTYNHESLLSQVLQFRYFSIDGKAYVILQVHGGCDVRGGYTAPKVFRAYDAEYVGDDTNILRDTDASISCDEHSWSTDGGYHFYSYEDQTQHKGTWPVDEDGAALCPVCKKKLHAWF